MAIGNTRLTRKYGKVVYKSGNNVTERMCEVFKLTHNNLQWMYINTTTKAELNQFFVEYSLAEGRVVTTGLGLGLLQTNLAKKSNVKEIIVFEKNPEVITMFNYFAKKSNFDCSKIVIINADASEASTVKCDWLLMDHFECVHQLDWEILNHVREIEHQCSASHIFFWPLPHLFSKYCRFKRLSLNSTSYASFRTATKINKLPVSLDDRFFPIMNKLSY
jgi:hypothetical protein